MVMLPLKKKLFASATFNIAIIGPANTLMKGALEYSIASWGFIQDMGQIFYIAKNLPLP